jgi:hypothetical protein
MFHVHLQGNTSFIKQRWLHDMVMLDISRIHIHGILSLTGTSRFTAEVADIDQIASTIVETEPRTMRQPSYT